MNIHEVKKLAKVKAIYIFFLIIKKSENYIKIVFYNCQNY